MPDPKPTAAGAPEARQEASSADARPIPVRDVLREGEARFRALTEHAGDAILEITPEGRFVYASPGFTELMGWGAEEVRGSSALELVHPDDLARVDADRERAFRDGDGTRLVFRFLHKDGSWRWIELIGRPYLTDAGERRAVLVGRDATERVEAERALRDELETETRIAALARRFLELDAESFAAPLRDGLAEAAKLAGAECVQLFLGGEVIVQHHWSAPGVAPPTPVDPEHGLERYPWTSALLLAGEAVHVPEVARLPDAAAAERAALGEAGVRSYLAVPVRRDGATLGFLDFRRLSREAGWSSQEVGRLRLVAEVLGSALRRVRAERERRAAALELERQLALEKRVADFSRVLIEEGAHQIDAGIRHGLEIAAGLAGADRAFLVSTLGDDARSAVYDWNAPDVPPRDYRLAVGRERQGWLLRRLLEGELVQISGVEELPEEAEGLRASLREGGVLSMLCIPVNSEDRLLGTLGFHCLKGPKRWSEREVALLRLVADLFTSALRRKRAELGLQESQSRLLQAQKMEAVGTLAGGIAHDFNNQLTVMLSNARFVLRETESGDEEVYRAVEDLDRAAKHCAQLTRSLLHFSRRSAASPRALDVAEVIADAEELLRPLIPSSIDFVLSRPSEPARLLADPTQLQQVLVNLVVNARDAMPDGGHLRIEAHPLELSPEEARRAGISIPGSYVEFSVRDTGMGMDEQTRARIFEPFFTTKPVGQGTGLGLATAYGIVQQCGGGITVESESGRGATFRVLLPRTVEVSVSAEATPAPSPRSGSGTVLVAEDEDAVRRLVARALRAAGYEVIEAPDGAEALRIGRQNVAALDALVTDIDMPRIGGSELARRLARVRPELPVLFISGTAAEGLDPSDPDATAGPSGFLAKPFTEQALLRRLDDLLRGR